MHSIVKQSLDYIANIIKYLDYIYYYCNFFINFA